MTQNAIDHAVEIAIDTMGRWRDVGDTCELARSKTCHQHSVGKPVDGTTCPR